MLSCFFRTKSSLSLVLAFIGLLWCGTVSLRALDRYVVEPGTIADGNGGIYTGWDIAATQIQWAVDASTNAGDTIWVSNGTYVLTNQISVISNIVLRSTNGPDVTIVNGNYAAGNLITNRCLYLSNKSAFVSGFTFSNGASDDVGGGGVFMGAGILSNCTACSNFALSVGSTGYRGGGGIRVIPSGTVTTCRVIGNLVTNFTSSGQWNGGGMYADGAGVLISNCLVSNNSIVGASESRRGGGVLLRSSARIRSSMICNNSNLRGLGGGIYLSESPSMGSCTVNVNQAGIGGGCEFSSGTITDCVISCNSASTAGGIRMVPGAASYVCRMFNTTVTGNTNGGVRLETSEAGVGGINQMINCSISDNVSNGVTMRGSASTGNSISNCIVRGNIGGILCSNIGIIRNSLIANNTNNGSVGGLLIGANCITALVSGCTIVSNQSGFSGAGIRIEATNASLLMSSCVICSNGVNGTNDVFDACAPTNYTALQYSCVGTNPGFTGAGIIADHPRFMDFAGGNFRLAGNSPCINTGSNETWMTNAFDLDGRTRIRYGVVDMGAYETIRDGTSYGFH